MVQLSPSLSSCRLDDTYQKNVSGHQLGSDQSRDSQERFRIGVERKTFLEQNQVSGRIADEDLWFHDSVSDKMLMQKRPGQKAMERGKSFAEVSRRETGGGVQASEWAHAERLQMVGAVDKAEKEGGLRVLEGSSSRPHWDFSGLPYPLTGSKRGMTVRELENIQSFDQAVIGTDLAGYITSWNKASETTYMWKAEEVVGRNLAQLLTPRDLQKNSVEVLGKGSHGELWSGPHPALRKDGVVIKTAVTTETPMVDQHNKILGIVKISVDLDSLPQVNRTDGREGRAQGRSFSDPDRPSEIELERVSQSGSDDGRNLLSWQRVRLEDESHAEESLPDAMSSSTGVSGFLRVGRSSVQNLLRKLQIGAGQRTYGSYDVSGLSIDRENNEMLFSDRSNPSSTGSVDHSHSFPIYGSLQENVDSEERYGSITPLMGPEVRSSRGEAELTAEGFRSQNEFSKDALSRSITVPNIATSNYALSRSSSGSPPSSATALEAIGSPFDRNGADNSRSTVESSLNFVQAEEDFQLQIAVALRVAAEAAAVDDPKMSANIWGPQGDVKLTPSCSKSEATAYRYWVSNCLGYEDRIEDGFYEVWGMSPYIWSMCTDSNELGRMPPLENLRVVPVNDDVTMEVLLVDRNMDPTLRELEEKAVCLAYESEDVLEMASQLSRIVSQVMGGPARSDDDLRQSWQEASSKLMQLLSTIVLPIGVLRVGLTRHRALLFKVMADSVGLACRIVRGSAFSGKDDDYASVVVKSDDNKEWMVDLLVRPGTRSLPDKRLAALPTVIPTPLQFERLNPFAGSNVSVQHWTRGEPRAVEGESPWQQYLPEPLLNTGSPKNNLGSKATSITQGLDFSLAEASNVETAPAKGSIEDGSKGKYGFVDLLDRPGLKNPLDPVNQIPESLKANSFLEDPLKLLNRKDNQKVGSGRDSKASVTSAEDGGRGYDRGWAREGRRPTGSDDSSKGVAGRVVEQILSEVSDFEIVWEDIILGERIGQGSFGKVYRGDWQGSDVAVKVFLDQDLRAEALDEYKSEMALMRRLRHPNIVLFMGAVSKPPNLSLITEFCPRGSLYRLLHRPNRELDDRRRIRMAMDVAKGMNYLHRCSPPVVHRDLKSPNLLVDKNWTVKVCDFGLSRQKHGTFLSSKSSAGTPEWMAPEVLRNEPSDEKSDVYSFGVILWELCTLQVPWNGMNPIQVVGAVGFQHRRLSIPDFVDESMAALIQACWRTDTKLRPSFADLMQELKSLQLRAVPGQPSPDQKDE